MHQLLALFPLNTLLFPGEMLPLHIFEERYKQMIGRCIERQEPFGVVLIQAGEEVGDEAEPFPIGTTAAIEQAMRFEDGRLLIVCRGGVRFRIHEMVHSEEYLQAAVGFLEDEVTPETQELAERIRSVYDRYRTAAPIVAATAAPLEDLPLDASELSFNLAEQLQVSRYSKQQLLECELETRLEALLAALEEETRMLPPSDGPPPLRSDVPWSLN